MRRLLWKEWRERGIWFLLWTLAVVGLSAFGMGQRFTGALADQSMWVFLLSGLDLLSGLLGYSSELVGERAVFLYSRAMLWKPLLVAKVLPGLLVTLISTVLGAVTCRLAAPAVYLPFVTPAHLLQGASETAGIAGASYLIGLGCSIVLPGIAGSIIALLCWFGLSMGVTQVQELLNKDNTPIWLIVGMLSAPVVAMVVIARFGLTLSRTQRVVRFGLVLVSVMVAGLLLNQVPSARLALAGCFPPEVTEPTSTSLSPHARFAAVMRFHINQWQVEWVDIATGKRIMLPSTAQNVLNVRWTATDDMLIIYNTPGITNTPDGKQADTSLAYWEHGVMRTVRLPNDVTIPYNRPAGFPSSDGQRLLFAEFPHLLVLNPTTGAMQTIANIPRKRKHFTRTDEKKWWRHHTPHCWWQGNRTVGYTDPDSGKTVLVVVR